MNMIEAVKTCFSKYATFSGRAMRSEFWWWMLFMTIVGIVLSMWMFSSVDWTALETDPGAMMGMFTGAAGILYVVFYLVTFIPSLAVGARRLHDTGKSGWWQLLWLLGVIPFAGLIACIVLIYFFVQKGQEGENKYG
jgi:uncharacterized membrane protein YhaH (DUF805 family)